MTATVPPETALRPLFRRPAVVRLLVVALLAEIGYAVLNISTMPVFLKFDRGFGALPIALVLVAFLLSEAVFKGPMGHLADRYGCKRLMLFGPVITATTSVLSLVIPLLMPDRGSSWEALVFILLRVGDGLGAAMLWPAAFALMGNTVRDEERQQAMSLLNMCYLLGIALALPVGGIVEDLTGGQLKPFTGEYSGGMILSATLFVGVALAVWRLIPKDEPHEIHVDEGEGFQWRSFLTSARQIPAYLALAIITFAGIGFPMAVIKLFAKDEFDMSSTQFGALVFPGAIAMAAFSVPMARLGERLGRAKAVHLGMGLCSAGLVFVCLGAFFPFFSAPWALAIGGIPVGMGFLLAIPAWLTAVSDIDPKRRAANLGAVMTAQGLGAIIGAPLGGLMYQELVPLGQRMGLGESFGHYSPFLGCAFCVTAGWLIGLKILRDPR